MRISKNRKIQIVVLLLLGILPWSLEAQPFVEYNGMVVIEAESTTLQGKWTNATTYNGYTASSYIYFNTVATNFNGNDASQRIEYKFVINNPGTYRVKIRNYIPDNNPTEHNDVFFRMDNGTTWKSFSHTNWQWNFNFMHDDGTENFFEPDYVLAAGEHTLYLTGRSPNFGLDRIHIYKVGTTNALDHTISESPRVSTVTELFATPSKLSLVMNTGDNSSVSPASPQIKIHNPGTGTLTGVQATENSDWLDISFSDNEGNDQVLDLSVNATANTLPTGTYNATVNITASNASPVTVDVSVFIHDGCYYLDPFDTYKGTFLSGPSFTHTTQNSNLVITSAGHDQWDNLKVQFNNGTIPYTVDVTANGSTPVIKFEAKASSNVLVRATILDANGVEAQNAVLSSMNNFEVTPQWQTFSVNLSGLLWDEWTGGGALDAAQLSHILFRINPGYTQYPHTGSNATYNTAFVGSIEMKILGFGNCVTDEITAINKSEIEGNVDVFPNPFMDQFTITLEERAVVSIYSFTGELVDTYELAPGNNNLNPVLKTGAYILKIQDEKGNVSNRKLVKH